MGNEFGNTIETFIGNVRFEGVKVLKSEVKNTSDGNLNCVWTDAGYFEFKDQPLWLQDGLAKVHSEVKKIKNPDLGEDANLLTIFRMTDGKFELQSDSYMGVGHYGDKDRDYSSFTINAKNGKKEAITTSDSNAVVIADEDDYVKNRKSPDWMKVNTNNTYIEHSPINTDYIEIKNK